MKNQRICIFAAYLKDGQVPETLIYYFKELLKICDGIVLVADNPIEQTELEKIKPYVIFSKFEKHGRYDFGSYAIGFEWFRTSTYFAETKELLFANDSVLGPYQPLSNFIDIKNRFNDPAFIGLTKNHLGWSENPQEGKIERPHVQSYFFTVKYEIYAQSYFIKFFDKISKEQEKTDIVIKYEIGLSELMQSHGYEPTACFDKKVESDPCKHFIKFFHEMFFIKKLRLKPYHTYKTNKLLSTTNYPYKIINKKARSCNKKTTLICKLFILLEPYRIFKEHPFYLYLKSFTKRKQ